MLSWCGKDQAHLVSATTYCISPGGGSLRSDMVAELGVSIITIALLGDGALQTAEST